MHDTKRHIFFMEIGWEILKNVKVKIMIYHFVKFKINSVLRVFEK